MKKAVCAGISALALLFASCEFWNEPVEEFFSYWASEAYISGWDAGAAKQNDSSGVTSIASGADGEILLKANNPKNFRFVMPTAGNSEMIKFTGLSVQPVPGTDYTLTQVSSDTLKLTYKSAFLQAHEWGNGDFGAVITLHADDGRKFSFNLKANTPPPTPSLILAQTNPALPAQPHYVFCLKVPDMTVMVNGERLHKDIAKIKINGTEYPLTINSTNDDFVKPSDARFIDHSLVVQLMETGSAIPPAASEKWILYYDTGVETGDRTRAYTVNLKDDKGLVSNTLEAKTSLNEPPAETVSITKGEQGTGTGTSNTDPIILKGDTSTLGSEIKIQNIAGTIVHCTVTDVVAATTAQYDANPVTFELGLNGADEKLYKMEYHTTGDGFKPSAVKTIYYRVLKQHTVTFNANGGTYTGGTTYTALVAHTMTATAPAAAANPTRTGYTFGSWYKEAACTTQWNFTSDTVTDDITLYAQWNPGIGTEYKVHHYKEGTTVGDYAASPEIESRTGQTDHTFTAAEINGMKKTTYQGFKLDKQELNYPSIKADGTTIIKLFYKRKTVTVTFKLDGGTIDSSTANVTRTGRFGTALTPPSPVKTGYTFNSWQPVGAAPALSSTFPASDAAYTAQWVANTNTPYKVKHLKQNITGSDYTEVTGETENLQGITGTNAAVTPKTYTGFEAGTYTSATIAADGSTVIEVRYNRKVYTVTFNANGGTPAPSNPSVRYEGKVIEPPTMSKTGYTFGGWYGTSALSGSPWNFTSGKVITHTNLYAKWTANTYKVKFNGGTGSSGSMSEQPFTYGTAQNLTANTFTKTDYRFTGWATSPGGSKMYDNQQSVNNLTTTNGGVVNLYAVWAPLPKVTFKVEGGKGGKLKGTYDGTTQEASGNTEKYFIVEYGSIPKVVAFTAVPDSGWALAEWSINPGPFSDGGPGKTWAKVTNITQNVIVTVKFYRSEISGTETNAWGVLKQAVKDAPAGKTIKITGTIQASSATGNNGELEVTKDLTIEAKSGTATLYANELNRIFKVTGGTLTLNNMKLEKGKVGTGEGGGIYVSRGTVILNNTDVAYCTAKDGGGIYLTGNGTKGSMYNTKILNNKAQKTDGTAKGGGICIADSASFEMDGGTTLDSKIDGNVSTGGTSSSSYGGGVCVIGNSDNGGTHASFIFKKGTISNNTARYGGGVMVEDGGTFTMEGRGESYKDYDNNIIKDNTADASGGGVAVHGAMTMNGGSIKNNKAKEGGCGIFLWHSQPGQTTLTMTNGFIASNYVVSGGLENKGKGVSVPYTGLTMKMSGYARIASTDDVYLTDDAKITVDSASFTPPSNNAATITPKYYNAGKQVLTGNYVGTHNSKFKVTPNGGQTWLVGSNGYLKTP